MPIPDLARVGAFLEEVAREHMLPFWRRLAPGDARAAQARPAQGPQSSAPCPSGSA